ncbi:hypothetical protein JRO89_XS11G0217200 [Xanthoceras sorbifolium]|uniref:Uncharacterized protein n=1 Tax=Xanthoceras sorbifolium TaxID=99658 RepID=A0ABQ8HGN1_9ROSI|nr:hypothetical protein JRO89_XS11G0217200 [Xanthoceras sorbifolium]
MKDSHSSAESQYPVHMSHEPPRNQQNNTPPAPAVDSGSETVSRNKSRKVSRDDVEQVQNLIERCLQLYMNREEVVHILLNQARVEPGITNLIALASNIHLSIFCNLVWQKLVEENEDFFKAYDIRLKLKRQITMFNKLLEQQYTLMESHGSLKVPLASMQNGSHHMPVDNLSTGYHMLQQPLMSSTGHPQFNSVGSMSNCHISNGIPAPGHFHPMAINLGKDMVMDSSMANNNSGIPINNIKCEIASDPSFVATCGQYPFESTAISDMSVDTPAIDSRFSSNIPLEGMQVGPYNGIGNSHFPQNLSISDLPTTELTDFTGIEMFDHFLADFPCQNLQPEEESHGMIVQSPKNYAS